MEEEEEEEEEQEEEEEEEEKQIMTEQTNTQPEKLRTRKVWGDRFQETRYGSGANK